jgi:hypothetical protein
MLYADAVPAALTPPPPGCSTDSFYIGSRSISTDNLPTDPEARQRAVLWLQKSVLSGMGTQKAPYPLSPVAGTAGGPRHPYVLKEKKRRVEEEKNGAPTSPVSSYI